MDGLLLHRLDLERVQLRVEDLAEVHHDGLVDLLPEVSPEDLDEGDLEGGDLAVHEDAGEVELHLEAHVDVGAVDGRRPPEREAAVGDLVEARPLGVGELLVLHRLLEARGLLPEEALPGGEVRALEERVLEDALHAAQRLDHVRAVVVEVPELAVVALVRPPEGVGAHELVLLEVLADAPALVVGEGVAVLLEEGVDARDAAVPRVLEVLEREPAVLRRRLLLLERVLRPDALRVDELRLPGLDVAVEVWDELVLLVGHARAEVGDARVRLLGEAQVRLGDEHVPHGEHAQAADLLGRVEDHRGEARGHLGVEADLDARLDLVLALDEHVEELLRVHRRLAVVGHEADERRVPLVGDLGEGGGPRGHQDLAHAVLELAQRRVVHAQEGLRRALLGGVVLEAPDAVARRELLVLRAHLGQDAHLEAAHVEEEVGVVLGVDGDEGLVPLHRGHRPGQAVLDVPEDRAAEVDVVLHEPHARVPGPALAVVVAHHVLVVGVGVLREVALDEVLGLLRGEAEEDVELVDVAGVEPHGVARLRGHVREGEEVVGHLGRARELRRAGEAQGEEVEDEPVVLADEGGELEAAHEAVGVGVVHVLEGDGHVVLGRHVVGDVVVHDEPKQAVEQGQVNLLEHLLELGLHHDHALAVGGVPDVSEVVHAQRPLVHEQGRRLRVRRLDPVGQQAALVRLVPEVLVEVGVSDLLQGLDLVDGHEVGVEVHELDAHLLEGALREEVALDAVERLVGVVVGLLDEAQLLALGLVEPRLDGVVLLEALEREDEELGVVLVGEGREGDGRELAALEPVHGRGVDGHRLLGAHVGPVLEVVVLALLLRLEPEAREPPEVLLGHGLVHRGAAADALTVVVRHVGPPVRLGLDVAQDHVLDGRGHAGHLPGDVGLPAAPGLGEVLEDGAALVGLDPLGHHVDDVVDDRGAQLEVKVRLDALLGHRLGHALGGAPLELAREKVAQPPLEEGHDAAEEEEPHAPARRPEAAAGPLAHGSRVEAVVDEVLEVLAHAHLAHEPVLVPVHARELPHVREGVLEPVRELVGVHVAQAVLHVRVHDELGEPEDLAAEVEGVPEAALLALLGGEGLHGLEVEVVVEVEVVDVLAVDEEVEHVVALAADLQARLHPVDLRRLEKLGGAQGAEEVLLVDALRGPPVELVEHVALEQLLVADAHLHRVVGRAVLPVPRVHQRHVDRALRAAGALVEGLGRPVEGDGAGCVLRVERELVEERVHALGEHEVNAVAEVVPLALPGILPCAARGRRRRRRAPGHVQHVGDDGPDESGDALLRHRDDAGHESGGDGQRDELHGKEGDA
mmetsp:Transcript_4532/g.13244  ORF Transcript_4532/g.13244 Transcript_4532/m.13244 type:complete len:1314 (+) Transcript_4532:2393-6334(+)